MQDHRQQFLELALDVHALRFGSFVLKSGRHSPYFFNMGAFNSSTALTRLASCYAAAIDDANIDFDVIFGPAYKGIPLAIALACWYGQCGRKLHVAYNRKEVKNHGEGGSLVGASLKDQRVLIIDDVITAGTTTNDALQLIRAHGGIPVAVTVALDRQEVSSSAKTQKYSVTQALARTHDISIIAIAMLDDLLIFLEEHPSLSLEYDNLRNYRQRYGCSSQGSI